MSADTPAPSLPVFFRYWAPVVIWILVISTMSGDPFSAQNTHRFIDPFLRYLFPAITPEEFRLAHFWIRKAAHFGEFFVLGGLAFVAWRRGRRPSWRPRWALQALALVVLCALGDELHQAFVPTRGPSLIDSGIDSLGGLASQVAIFVWYRVSRRRSVFTAAVDDSGAHGEPTSTSGENSTRRHRGAEIGGESRDG